MTDTEVMDLNYIKFRSSFCLIILSATVRFAVQQMTRCILCSFTFSCLYFL